MLNLTTPVVTDDGAPVHSNVQGTGTVNLAEIALRRPITEVADAQRVLAQAESDAAVARLSVWRAVLAESQAAGDLTPFLHAIRMSGGH